MGGKPCGDAWYADGDKALIDFGYMGQLFIGKIFAELFLGKIVPLENVGLCDFTGNLGLVIDYVLRQA
jgi:hypothetical protein